MKRTYAQEFVRCKLERIVKSVTVEQDDAGNAIITFRGRREVVPMKVEVEEALRALSDAVDRLFEPTTEEKPA